MTGSQARTGAGLEVLSGVVTVLTPDILHYSPDSFAHLYPHSGRRWRRLSGAGEDDAHECL